MAQKPHALADLSNAAPTDGGAALRSAFNLMAGDAQVGSLTASKVVGTVGQAGTGEAARLALTEEQAVGFAVVDADTGKTWMLKPEADWTGASGAWNAVDWLQLGDNDDDAIVLESGDPNGDGSVLLTIDGNSIYSGVYEIAGVIAGANCYRKWMDEYNRYEYIFRLAPLDSDDGSWRLGHTNTFPTNFQIISTVAITAPVDIFSAIPFAGYTIARNGQVAASRVGQRLILLDPLSYYVWSGSVWIKIALEDLTRMVVAEELVIESLGPVDDDLWINIDGVTVSDTKLSVLYYNGETVDPGNVNFNPNWETGGFRKIRLSREQIESAGARLTMGSVVEVGVFNGWAVANTQPWRATVTWLGGGTSVYSGGVEALSIGNQNTQITYAEWLLLPGNAGKTIDQYTTEGPHFEEYLPNGSFTVAAPWAALTPESIGVDPALTTFLSSASTMDGTEKAAVRGLIDAAAVGESLPAVGDDGEVLTVVGGTWESAPAAGGSTETAETIGQKLYAAGDLDRTPTDADAVAVLDESSSPTKGNGKRLTFASLWSWLQNKITSTALVFSARPSCSVTSAPTNNNDLLRVADGDARYGGARMIYTSESQIDATTLNTSVNRITIPGISGIPIEAGAVYLLEFFGYTVTTGGTAQFWLESDSNFSPNQSGALYVSGHTTNGSALGGYANTGTWFDFLIRGFNSTGTYPAYGRCVLRSASSNIIRLSFSQNASPVGTSSLLAGAKLFVTRIS